MSGSLFGNEPSAPVAPLATTTAVARWWSAHCDGGSRGNPGPAAFGAVVVDPDGHKAAELSEFLGVATNNVAEYRGLLATLDWAVAHQVGELRVVSDSLLMVQQIKGRYKVNSADLRPLWQAARDRIGQLHRFEISHALRHKNKDADRLANEAMDRGTGKPAAGRPGFKPDAKSSDTKSSDAKFSDAKFSEYIDAKQPHAKASRTMRGFVRDGVVHFLDGASVPDGVFVSVVAE